MSMLNSGKSIIESEHGNSLENDSNYIEKYTRLLLATNDNEDDGERNEVDAVIVKKGHGIKRLSVWEHHI